MIEAPSPEGGHLTVQAGADAGHLALGDPAGGSEGGDEVVDLAGGHAVHVGLHHHREQGPVDSAAPLQDRGEEAALAQLRDLQLHIARLRCQQPVTVTVALGGARLGALVAAGADVLGRLRLDQGLQHELDALADHVDVATSADRVQQLVHVRLGQRHRLPPKLELSRSSRRSPGGPTPVVGPPGFYTTRWDVNPCGVRPVPQPTHPGGPREHRPAHRQRDPRPRASLHQRRHRRLHHPPRHQPAQAQRRQPRSPSTSTW